MSSEHPPSAPPETNGAPVELQQEIERLREAVRRLEGERRQDAERFMQVEQERDEFRRIVYDHARSLFTEEELTRIPDEKDCQPFEAFAAELDEIVARSESGQ